MNPLNKLLGGVMLGGSIVLPVLASSGGWGISSEKNPKVLQEMRRDCPAHLRDGLGNCRKTHRSYYYRRSYRGGGPRGGK